MAETFDAAATALEIEKTAKLALDNMYDFIHPIESGIAEGQAERQLNALFDGLKDPLQLKSVGLELEKLSEENFSALPDVKIKAPDGNIKSISFDPSFWDFSCHRSYAEETMSTLINKSD